MKYFSPFFLLFIALLAPMPLFGATQNSTYGIESIFFQKKSGNEIIQVRLSGKVIPKIFELGGEKPRVVLDFIDTLYTPKGLRTINAGGDLVKRIRVGLHAKPVAKTRVVVDLVEGEEYSFSTDYNVSSTLFRITFTPPVELEMKQALKKKVKPAEPKAVKENTAALVESTSTLEVVEKNNQPKQQDEMTPAPMAGKGEGAEKANNLENIGATDVEEAEEAVPSVGSTQDQGEVISDGLGAIDEPTVEEQEAANILPEEQKQQVLLKFAYEQTINGSEMVLFYLNGFYPPVVYSAESGELFVVCDFMETVPDRGVSTSVASGGRFIERIKIEKLENPLKTRAVLELAENHNYDLRQVFFKENNLFVIIIDRLKEKDKN